MDQRVHHFYLMESLVFEGPYFFRRDFQIGSFLATESLHRKTSGKELLIASVAPEEYKAIVENSACK